MRISLTQTRKALRLAASASLALVAVISAACHSVGDQAEGSDTTTLEITFKEQEARLLANRMRGFDLGGLEVLIQAPDSRTWIVSGPKSDVRAVRYLARVLDTTLVTPKHVVRTYDIEHHDARSLANATRGRGPKGQHRGVLAISEGTWYVIVRSEEVGALEAWLAEIDSPGLRITSEGVLESV